MKYKDKINLEFVVEHVEESTEQVCIHHPLFGYKWVDIDKLKTKQDGRICKRANAVL